MTIFETTFRDLLIAANLVDRRVFILKAPQVPAAQAKTPYVVFQMVAPTTGNYPHDGPLDLIDRDYQVAVLDGSQTRVIGIADSFREYLDGFRGTFQNVRFGMIRYTNQTLHWEPDTQLFQIILEFRIQFHLTPTPQPLTQQTRSIRSLENA